MTAPLLEVRDLRVRFDGDDGSVSAVNGVSFAVAPGEALALVGESGSGKSVSMLSVMGLLPPVARVEAGEVLWRGRDLLRLSERELQGVRGREVAMVYQDPQSSLNPALTVGTQLTMVLRHHLGLGRRAARARAAELLALVGIPEPQRRLDEYPHRFSGGQRQRILIALALACDPRLLIADEPTTALDVTIQAQILDLVRRLREQLEMAIVWITHDLGVVAGLVDRVAVMYGGTIVEEAPVRELFAAPSHPYTVGLLAAMPRLDEPRSARLRSIPGAPQSLAAPPVACPFAPRCEWAVARCSEELPALRPAGPLARAACHRADEVRARTEATVTR
ncbi:ABC transporter ATP-binding protein [Conexibacter stalactiti]|uniref:ABC transporter ATP-binding protein n=1 Tax=Conexibacter stalactiti TaxID=1940611 RepID=A0ABU4HUJ6_9ACTN|nr:ABC transporter ATP-binding protein [Conexibacter stalactiti]MDW5596995.1 ABC transporter ATP-binding protein [Conexibacter stalactiti]MEC5037637.1 ABC transporter ATP-binding protein [Conexibacter stalactiti]